MKTVALDIGNVCIKIQPERCFSELGLKINTHIPNELLKSISNFENGFIDEKCWLQTFQKVTNKCFSDDDLREAYCKILGNEYPETENFVRKAVSKNYRIIFFSDTSPIHINQIYRNLSYANLISGGVYSFEAGFSKPDLHIFKFYEKKFGIPTLYIDDKLQNIEAGKKVRWNSILFESAESLKIAYDLL